MKSQHLGSFNRDEDEHIEQLLRFGDGDDAFLEERRWFMAVKAETNKIGSRYYNSTVSIAKDGTLLERNVLGRKKSSFATPTSP